MVVFADASDLVGQREQSMLIPAVQDVPPQQILHHEVQW
jgi:hypothetical protein